MALVAHEETISSTSTNYGLTIDSGEICHICKGMDAISDSGVSTGGQGGYGPPGIFLAPSLAPTFLDHSC